MLVFVVLTAPWYIFCEKPTFGMFIHARWNCSIQGVIFTNCSSGRHRSWQTHKVYGNLKQGPNNATGCLSLQEMASLLVSPDVCEGGTEVDCAAMWCQWDHCQHKVHRLLLASFPGPTQFMLHHEDHNCHQVHGGQQLLLTVNQRLFFFFFPTWRIWTNSPWTRWRFLCNCVF